MLDLRKIPASLDPAFYQSQIEPGEDARSHFLQFGKQQGLEGSPACNQGYFVRLIHHMDPGSVLEIGPGSSPRVKGENTFYFDVKDENELAHRYREIPNNNVPSKIHFVDKKGDLNSIRRKFDIIFSCHAIEHVDDIVSHFISIKNLLNDGGLYFLVIPNKKYSFDYFKPNTTVEDAVFAHYCDDGGDSVLFRSVLFEHLRRTHNDPVRHWAGDHGRIDEHGKTVDSALREFQNKKSDSVYRSGFHRWFFDENSFPNVVNALYDSGLSPLKVHECYNTPKNSMSFNAIVGS